MSDQQSEAATPEVTGPGPLSQLCDKEWQDLLDKDDRTSPADSPDMVLIRRAELGGAMSEAYLLAKQKPDPNPEWEAMAKAVHDAIVAEVGVNPFDTLTMLEKWTAHAEPADQQGKITFSRAMLDSATDALRMALEIARGEYLRAERFKTACSGIADDYMTSEGHHPGYVLIPTARFEAIKAAATDAGGEGEPQASDQTSDNQPDDDEERCLACAKPIQEGELVLADASGGIIHRSCCGPEREGFCNLETGEPLGPDEQLPEGWPWKKDAVA